MKIIKRSKIKMVIALVWAAILLVGSFLMKSVEGHEQLINFLILAIGINVSLLLNGTMNWSCKVKES